MGKVLEFPTGALRQEVGASVPVHVDPSAREALVNDAVGALSLLAAAAESLLEGCDEPKVEQQAAKDLMELYGQSRLAVRALVHHLDPNLSVE